MVEFVFSDVISLVGGWRFGGSEGSFLPIHSSFGCKQTEAKTKTTSADIPVVK